MTCCHTDKQKIFIILHRCHKMSCKIFYKFSYIDNRVNYYTSVITNPNCGVKNPSNNYN